jgi:hypothetical protein
MSFFSDQRYIVPGLFFFILSLLFSSCKTEKSFIPAYIQIDEVILEANSIQGNSIHDIKAVQIYINNQTVGTFTLPCKFPVNADGLTRIQAAAFVKINGNSQTLVPFKSIDILSDTLQLIREQTVIWQPQFKYRQNTRVVWQEDFEDSSSTLVPINKDSLDFHGIEKRAFSLSRQFSEPSLVYVSKFNHPDTFQSMDLAFFQRIAYLPSDGRDVILEFDILTELPVLVALRRFTQSNIEFVPYVTVNPTGGLWKRFYINLLYEIQGQPSTNQYEIFFSADKPKNFAGSTEFLIDNIRLTYLE